ncbi:MAG: hypothetical protein AVDCRST_MAG93-7233 [uncultured Chloroflexia bacterium]|uniref:Uncharacterized protein n=1 Tax=uncultured Chloroflexia bacterium TaxID=1672391 RepID=A0A6J4M9B5_9CHLR|nr:MAG: hypothetical protein AVDCRST_MAG93-7233 [uncultured Chloroflexia bacterium]
MLPHRLSMPPILKHIVRRLVLTSKQTEQKFGRGNDATSNCILNDMLHHSKHFVKPIVQRSMRKHANVAT